MRKNKRAARVTTTPRKIISLVELVNKRAARAARTLEQFRAVVWNTAT